MNQSTTNLMVSLDLGASASKGIYTFVEEEETHLIKMGSEVAEVPIVILKNAISFNQSEVPEDNAWIKKTVNSKTAMAIGTIAKSHTTKGEQIENVKYEFAVDKCVGIIGAIATKHKLKDRHMEVELNLLIPFDEKESQEVLRKNLQKRLKKFYFRDADIRCKLSEFRCYAEGTGGVMSRMDRDKNIVVLMFGHRNCSCLIYKSNSLDCSVERLGYFDYLKGIKDIAIGQTIENLEQIIPKIEVEMDRDKKDILLNSLIRANRQSNKKEERKTLIKALGASRANHWNKICNWLETKIPTSGIDEVLILGGASRSFKTEILEYLDWVDVNWFDDTICELQKFGSLESNVASRYVDVFSLHKQHVAVVCPTQTKN